MKPFRSSLIFIGQALVFLVTLGCTSSSSTEPQVATATTTTPPPPAPQAAPPGKAPPPTTAASASKAPPSKAPPPAGKAGMPPPATAAAPDKDKDDWPRQFKRSGITYTMYQPQIESWEGDRLGGRAAVAYQADGATQATYGVVYMEARTEVEKADRLVFLDDLKITRASFPAETEREESLGQTFRQFLTTSVPAIGLDRLEASLAVAQQQKLTGTPQLRNEPPNVVFTQTASMLIALDGSPQFGPVANTSLQRVLNTRVLLLKNAAGTCYLHLFDGFVSAPSLNDRKWAPTPATSELIKAKDTAVAAKQVDLLAGQPNPDTEEMPKLGKVPVPSLIVVSQPTELIVTSGEPKWEKIPSTELSFISNTASHVFRLDSDKSIFVLISGRWFRSGAFAGPWAYVAPEKLPKDFAAIPDESPQENVKASVPGTRQAKEAAIASSIPQTTKVERAKASMEPPPAYDGGPKLATIEGTPLSYVVNCPTPVIKVDEKTWYACQNGVWFVATSATGPWTVAENVPAVIYTIPASSPVHYVTYVKIYRSDPTYVWVGYTPGYYGAMVTDPGVVVYGTGYTYVPYVSTTVYVSYPVTYGYATNMCWTPWAGWAFGFGVGFAWAAGYPYWACCPAAPYWGAYWGPMYGWGYSAHGGIAAWGPYGWAGTSGNIYSHAGPWHGVSRVSGGYNAWTGNRWASQYGRAYNSATGTRAAGQRGAVSNVYTGNYAFGASGVARNDATGITAVGQRGTAGNAYTGREVSGGRGTVYNPNTGKVTDVAGFRTDNGGGALKVGDNVVAGKDGQVYARDSTGEWQSKQRDSASTLPASTSQSQNVGSGTRGTTTGDSLSPTGRTSASSYDQSQYQSYDREVGARSQGSQRSQSFQSNRPAYGGGGGYRGGGGGGRRR